ncbi:hypothetical protein ACFL0O_04135 [Thermodesulfobacteriota bacterium]
MRKLKFTNIYLLLLAIVFFALGAFTELHFIYYSAMAESAGNKSYRYPEFIHLFFFFLGFATIISIYFSEKREANVLSSANIALQREIDERKRVEKEREGLIDELQITLAEVQTLSGLLPICASCKKIRDDQGYWNQIESYIRERSDAEFSHGICPECAKNLYPEFDIND